MYWHYQTKLTNMTRAEDADRCAVVTRAWHAGAHSNNDAVCSNTTSGIITTHHPGHRATHMMHHLLLAELYCTTLRMQAV